MQIRIEIVATIDWTAGIELQKLIKSRFEYDLDQNLASDRSNRISLLYRYQSIMQLKVLYAKVLTE